MNHTVPLDKIVIRAKKKQIQTSYPPDPFNALHQKYPNSWALRTTMATREWKIE